MNDFDYIVVGGGTAGCVLASRLSEDAGVTVLLLEAGAEQGSSAMSDPAGFRTLLASSVDWNYRTTPQVNADGAPQVWARGRVLGGSSSINAMAHLRGHHSDYDQWEAEGATGWGYRDLLPYFKRSESTAGRDPELRGSDGPMQVAPVSTRNAGSEAFHAAMTEVGYPATADINGTDQEGVFWYDLNVVDGRRQSAADAYLRPVQDRPNLTVTTNAQVRRLILDRGRCTGVEFGDDGDLRQAHAAAEVVVTAGVVGSAQLLLLSGIGPAQHLREVGLDVVVDLPGVGANLHDHVQSGLIYAASEPIETGTNGICPAGAIVRSDPALSRPDVQLTFLDAPVAAPSPQVPRVGYTISFAVLHPESRGSIRLAGPDPEGPPLIDPNYLDRPADLDALVTALGIARSVGESTALTKWRSSEALPGQSATSSELRAYLRRTARTFFHPVGTCKLGVDELAVVNPDLTVRGVEGLRVADASVMPSIIGANTNATVLAIAERCAGLIRGEALGR